MPARRTLSPRKHPVQERALATVEAVLQAAGSVFSTEGYAAGTTNRIAEKAGVSIGTLYQYFPNKDALLIALVERHTREASALIEDLLRGASGSVQNTVRQFVTRMIALHEKDPDLHRMLFEQAPHPAALLDALGQIEDATVDAIEALLRAHPDVKVKHPEVAAYLLVQSIEALCHRFVLHPPRSLRTRACFVEEVVSMLSAYLVTSRRS